MNDITGKIYCIDSSVFISLNRINQIIPIPDIWIEFDKLFRSGRLLSHEFVYEEFNPESKNPDFLAKWMKDKKEYFVGTTEKQFQLVEKILERFEGLINPDKEKNEADPWIIALAIEKNEEVTLFGQNIEYYVVSREKIKSSTKIPAACRAFNVPHMSFEEFLEDNGWRLGIIKT